METSVTIQPATSADRPAIVSLLQEAKLPTQDLPICLDDFLVGKALGNVIGSVGFERLGEVALLRSMAVSPSFRGTGLGKKLYEAALSHASGLGIESVYLITTTADGFFEKQGFQRIDRSATPAAVQETAQFSGVCPSSAVVMAKTISH